MSQLTFGFKRWSRTVVRRESNGFTSDLSSLRKLRSVQSCTLIGQFGVWKESLGEEACAHDLEYLGGVLVLKVG